MDVHGLQHGAKRTLPRPGQSVGIILSMDAMTVAEADAFARRSHDGQCDKVGMPYFETHVQDVHRRVAEAGADQDQQVAALLHDVLEDTDVTEADLRAAGISEQALRLVVLMTKHDGLDKTLCLTRIRDHEPVRQIKLADIASNTDPVRLARLDPERRRKVLTKYADYLESPGADARDLQAAFWAVPTTESEDERQARLDRILDDRMAARLDERVAEDSFSPHEEHKRRHGPA